MPAASKTAPAEAPTTPRRALVTAAVIALVIEHLVPFGRLILYPFTLLATWVHEMGHGLTALIVGGSFSSLDIFRDASGLAHTHTARGFPSALVSMGGLLAPPFVGAATLALGRGPKRARVVLLTLALALVLSLAVWVRSLAGWIAMPLVAAVVAAFGVWGSARERVVFAQFIGLLLGFDTLARVDYLFTAAVTIQGREQPSDVALIVGELGSYIPLWGVLLAGVGLGALVLGLRVAWRAPKA
ncbi:MAG: M50 family metallopeptidase [Polyangiales bacterium]